MDEIIEGFITEMFGDELLKAEFLSDYQRLQIKNSMIMFAFAHRHNKSDNFLTQMKAEVEDLKIKHKKEQDLIAGIHSNFALVRDVQYLYSKKAQEKFFNSPIENYFFVKYAQSEKGKTFLKNKPVALEDPEKFKRLKDDTEELR